MVDADPHIEVMSQRNEAIVRENDYFFLRVTEGNINTSLQLTGRSFTLQNVEAIFGLMK